jgi:hypothetical protein
MDATISDAANRRGDRCAMRPSVSAAHAPRMNADRRYDRVGWAHATGRGEGGTIVGNEPRPLAAQP